MQDRLVSLPGGPPDDAAVDEPAASRLDRAGDDAGALRRDGVGIEVDAVETVSGHLPRHRLGRRRWTDADDALAPRTEILHGAHVEEAVLLGTRAGLVAAASRRPAHLVPRGFRRGRQ